MIHARRADPDESAAIRRLALRIRVPRVPRVWYAVAAGLVWYGRAAAGRPPDLGLLDPDVRSVRWPLQPCQPLMSHAYGRPNRRV